MTDDNHACERCATCGRNFADIGAFCRLYLEDFRVSLCTPACATRFLRGPERSAATPAGDLITELVEDWRWTWEHGLRPVCVQAGEDDPVTRLAETAPSRKAGFIPSPTVSEFLPMQAA